MIAVCLHCKHMYTGPDASVLNESEQDRHVRFIQRLARHIQAKHPDQAAIAVSLGSEMVGLALLSNFQSTDAEFLAQRDKIRQRIHSATEPPEMQDMTPDVADLSEPDDASRTE